MDADRPVSAPRIPPGSRAQIGRVNHGIARVIGRAAGGGPPNVFTTLGRHPVFRRWLRFAAGLMPGGTVPRADTELLILRVADRCHSAYEWAQHERIALTVGLTQADVTRVREGPDAVGWSPRQALLLRAADELLATHDLSDALWAQLRAELSDEQLIEVCLVVGNYAMLAMTLNALRVQPDPPAGRPPRVLQALQRRLDRGRGQNA